MKIAVTGGNGGLGRRLIPYLLELGHTVISIDRSLPPRNSPADVLRAYNRVADTTDFGQVVGSIDGCEAVIHLAAHVSPWQAPEPVVYHDNSVSSYNVLSAAAALGIKRVCLASSINAIGGVYSQSPRYDYFPVDEKHPTYAEDAYSLSKWVMEKQGDAFARRYPGMSIASMRFHWLVDEREHAFEYTSGLGSGAIKHLWAYTLFSEANRACLLALTADYTGHEVFYIAAPRTAVATPSMDLANEYYPDTPIRGDMSGHTSFFDCSRAAAVLGWVHEE